MCNHEREDEFSKMLRDLLHQAEMISQAANKMLRLVVEANPNPYPPGASSTSYESLAERIGLFTSDEDIQL